ncbi:TonB-dependent receptor plug domain-containing protein [Riemerella anatipestifer]|uniref:TonB-dependent receptor n=1 Tax=Riemerella anatipestifer TaxID=34085 RepID=UPI0021F86F6A|nr:TonB-dependent receptor plug domain-containing protein [Riemerella anatipestifer]MCW0479946.1 TonB-dependent receptor plug domain-containing protein [Riemerella anatipestifer]
MNLEKMRGILLLCFFSWVVGIAQTPKEKTIDTVSINENRKQAALNAPIQKIKEYTGSHLAEMLKNTPGVSIVQTGANVSKPIIEGLSSNRVLILHNGVKLLNQDWSDHHAPEVDITAYQDVKIIKGARSVRYGSGALGGVILLSPKPLSFHNGLNGSVSISGNSNDGKSIINTIVRSSIKNTWAWQIQQSYHYSGDYKTANYYVNNTGYRQLNTLGMIGYKKGIFSGELSFNRFYTEMGVFYGSLTGNIEEFSQKINDSAPEKTSAFSYNINAPKQNTTHLTLKFDSKLNFDTENFVTIDYSYQNNYRKEFDVRRLDRTSIPTQHLNLDSHLIESIWNKTYFKNLKGSIGLQYHYQENTNIPGTGVPPTIPNYLLHNYAAFFTSEYFKNSWRAELGLRYDYRKTNALGYNFLGNLYGSKRAFSNLSYNLLVEKKMAKRWNYSLDFGLAWRSPEPYEMYVNGKQHGIPIFYIGKEDLESEKGFKISQKIGYLHKNLKIDVSTFLQPINGYIHSIPSGNYKYLFSGPSIIFQMVQSNAFFRGGDISLDWKISSHLRYKTNVSVVYANDAKTKDYLPMIPPLTLYQQWKWQIPSNLLNYLYITAEHQYAAQQKRYNPKQDLMPPPSAYHTFGFNIATEFYYTKQNTCFVALGISNLTNQQYKNYTDHFRYFVHAKGIDFQLKTIINF